MAYRLEKTSKLVIFGLALLAATPVLALDKVEILVQGVNEKTAKSLKDQIELSSLTNTALENEVTDTQDILASAQAEYRRLVGLMYDNGYYGPEVHVFVDGREAANIDPIQPPATISKIQLVVTPGKAFTFGKAQLAPREPQAAAGPDPVVDGFVPGAPAKAPVVGSAATAALREWRQAGHPKASVKSQDIIARHKAGELDVDIKIDPDQRLRFGTVTIKGESDVRRKRIREILGWPEGEIYDPELQNEAGNRLRRAGAFKTVSLQEGEVVGDQLNYNLTVIDQPKRRFGFSAELATVEGLQVGGFWMHRNVFGGSERFRVDAEVSNIGGEQSGLGDKGGVDYSTTFRLTRPAAYGPDNWAFLYGEFEHLDEPDYTETQATLGIGITRYFSDRLFGEIALGYRYSYADDAFGEHDFNHIVFPSRLEWDYRDEIGDPKTGVYFDGRAMPFFGVNGSEDGALIDLDNRGYLSFGAEDKFTLAGRAQIGSVLFASQEGTPPDFLFYSGGGDTVRGQKYQSLGANEINGDAVGGRSFLALSGEIRARVTKSLGVVGFYDIGYVGAESWLEADDPSHSGAGIGFRYATPIGPLRMDLATPVSGTGDSFKQYELYIGVGQAF